MALILRRPISSVFSLQLPVGLFVLTLVPQQNFWLGTRRVTARGKPCSHHLNVVFLRVLPGTLSLLFDLLSRVFPASWRERVEARWPEWFLPDHIIMKREKPGWEEEFDTEVDIYGTLAPLGGRVVPKLDGVRRRALILSDIDGFPLGEPEVGSLPLDRVEGMMKDAFQALADAGVGHGDPKLDNMHVVGDKIMLSACTRATTSATPGVIPGGRFLNSRGDLGSGVSRPQTCPGSVMPCNVYSNRLQSCKHNPTKQGCPYFALLAPLPYRHR
jgi:hypothetical protein